MQKSGFPIVLALAALSAGALLGACGGDDAAPGADALRTVDVGEFAAAAAEPDRVLLDVRTPEEFAEGHLADARLLDFYDPAFAANLDGLDRDVPYAIYCRSGNRSGQALAMMRDLGFTDVVDLAGGIGAWTAAGQSVVV